jgi:hypothetical protein
MKVDLKADYKAMYTATANPCMLVVPELPYLMIDGVGAPSGTEFERAMKALFSMAYGLKYALKPEADYKVMPVEGLWGSDPTDHASPVDTWRWTLLILQPVAVTPDHLDAVATKVRKAHPDVPVDSVRLERFAEGRSVQILHVGPYAEEPATIQRLLAYAGELGYAPSGRHHEVYLSDPARTAPEKLKTILRYPVTVAAV